MPLSGQAPLEPLMAASESARLAMPLAHALLETWRPETEIDIPRSSLDDYLCNRHHASRGVRICHTLRHTRRTWPEFLLGGWRALNLGNDEQLVCSRVLQRSSADPLAISKCLGDASLLLVVLLALSSLADVQI